VQDPIITGQRQHPLAELAASLGGQIAPTRHSKRITATPT